MYNPIEAQLYDSLKREGKTILTYDAYGASMPVTCLFRKNADKNALEDKRSIFYPQTASITQGTLVKYKSDYFLAVNSETSENDVYRRSDLVKMNAIVNVITESGYELVIQAHAYDWTSVSLINSSMITTVDGTIELIAADNDQTRRLSINDNFGTLGAWWTIFSVYYKDGICHIYVKRIATPSTTPVYTLEIGATGSEYIEGTTAILSAVAKADDTTILNATLTWQSSDESIATINQYGNLTCIAEGAVIISCTWLEHNVTDNVSIEVQSDAPPDVYTCSITYSGDPMLYYGMGTKTFTGNFFLNGTPITTLTPDWTVDAASDLLPNIQITEIVPTIKLKALTADTVGRTFNLILTDTEGLCPPYTVLISVSSSG